MFTPLITAIEAADTIIIHRHINPDPDAFGSQLGLQTLLRAQFPTKRVLAAGAPDAGLAWIGTPDAVADADYAEALAIVIDCANLPRVDDQRFALGKTLMKIDHHPNREPFGDLSYVDTDASSSSEIVCDLATAAGWPLPRAAAAKLYAGIIGDTGRFKFDLTTAKTLRVASRLMDTGIDAPAIARAEESLSPAVAKLVGDALVNVSVSAHGAGGYTVTTALREHYGVALGEEQLAVNYIGRLTTIAAWIMFTERPDGRFRCELRSKHKPISGIAVAHGGGGHPLASGAVAQDAAECAQMLEELDVLLTEDPQ